MDEGRLQSPYIVKGIHKYKIIVVIALAVFFLPMTAMAKSEVKQERSLVMVQTKSESFVLPALPYEEGALEPVISAKTLSFHYGKHHQAYVNKLNELV